MYVAISVHLNGDELWCKPIRFETGVKFTPKFKLKFVLYKPRCIFIPNSSLQWPLLSARSICPRQRYSEDA